MLRIAIFGTGYVGLVSGVCLADFGLNVTCVDVDEKKITLLNEGKVPIYEPGMDVYLDRNQKAGRIAFTTDAQKAIENSDVIFIAVGTPPSEDGSANMEYVYSVAKSIGAVINGYKIVVDKSTVPIGTGQKVKSIINEEMTKRGVTFDFDVVSNPEFLREGKALQDFTHPDRVVIGVESEQAAETMKKVYRPLYLNETPFIITNIETAEMIKYACNAFLATKITFVNEIANLCEQVGADIKQVSKAMGRDGRISPKFLHAGPGYGGSCFPKDTLALKQIAEKQGCQMKVVSAVIEANEYQKKLVVEKLRNAIGSIKDKTIAVLGLSFKPETNDVREAPSMTVLRHLINEGAKIRAYDPQAMEESKKYLQDYSSKVEYCKHVYDAAEGADALIILTEWHEFRNMDMTLLKKIMKYPLFYDTRNIYPRNDIQQLGFKYIGTGA